MAQGLRGGSRDELLFISRCRLVIRGSVYGLRYML
jgi:hypothetical protein